jgi:hypothetical protein
MNGKPTPFPLLDKAMRQTLSSFRHRMVPFRRFGVDQRNRLGRVGEGTTTQRVELIIMLE